jgi:NadR type nicotinamide-nucleotide adenylyltransferase
MITVQQIKKIVIVGPESTGKSTLCRQLADHYHSMWCPEYAREYLLKNGTNYTFENLLDIAKGQLALEEKTTDLLIEALIQKMNSQPKPNAKPYLFIDTDMYVMKVWCEFVFGKCHNWILDRIVERKYDLYLLCKPDLPWVKDELREYPDEKTRIRLYHHYRELLTQQSIPWFEVSGLESERLTKAVVAIEHHL